LSEQAEALMDIRTPMLSDDVPVLRKKYLCLKELTLNPVKLRLQGFGCISHESRRHYETFPETSFDIVGHTDNVEVLQRTKSFLRIAQSVKRYLVEKGIDEVVFQPGAGDTQHLLQTRLLKACEEP
jgi:hypothetical protein